MNAMYTGNTRLQVTRQRQIMSSRAEECQRQANHSELPTRVLPSLPPGFYLDRGASSRLLRVSIVAASGAVDRTYKRL